GTLPGIWEGELWVAKIEPAAAGPAGLTPPEPGGLPAEETSGLNPVPGPAAPVAAAAVKTGASGGTYFFSGISFFNPQNAAVTAAPNPHTLTTPRAINPKTGTI